MNQEVKEEKKKWQVVISAMMLWMVASTATLLSPALASFQTVYPEQSYASIAYITSLPLGISILSCILAGAFAGRKIRYRTIIIISFVLQVIGGIAPFFFPQPFELMLFWRAVWGIGFGGTFALNGTIVIRLFKGKEREKMFGLGGGFQSVLGIVFPLIVGIIAVQNVSWVWLTHLIALLALIIVIFWLPEPEADSEEEILKQKADKKNARIIPMVWVIIFSLLLNLCAAMVFVMSSSAIIVGEGIGDAAAAGVVVSCNFVGALLGSTTYPKFAQIAGRFSIGVSLVVCALGTGIAAFGHSLPLLIAGSIILGFGNMGWYVNSCFSEMGRLSTPPAMAKAGGFWGAAGNLGSFLVPSFISIVAVASGSADLRIAVAAGATIQLILAVFFVVSHIKMTQLKFATDVNRDVDPAESGDGTC